MPKTFDRRNLIKKAGLVAGGAVLLSDSRVHASVRTSASQIVDDYGDLRGLTSSTLTDSDIITVTKDGIAGDFVIKTGTVTDNGGTRIVFTDDSNRYALRMFDDSLNVQWFGAVADAVTDDHTAIMDTIKEAIDVRATRGVPTIGIYFPPGKYAVEDGLPIVSGLIFYCTNRWESQILCRSSTPTAGFYTATHASGVFTDTLDATLSEVMLGTKEVSNAGITNLVVEHNGGMTGTSGSGVDWDSVIQIVGAPNIQLIDVQCESHQDDINGMSLKYCWRANVDGFLAPRSGATTGGRGLDIGSQCNASKITRAVTVGKFDYGIAISGVEELTIDTPNCELTLIAGLAIAGNGIKVVGGYYEGNTIDIQLGFLGSNANGCEIQGTWHNGNGYADYAIDLNEAINNLVRPRYFTGAYIYSHFRSNSNKSQNYGNIIETTAGDADAYNLAAFGLDDGRNIVRVTGQDHSDHRAYVEYSTDTLDRLTPSVSAIKFPETNIPSTDPSVLDDYFEKDGFVPTFTTGTSGSITLDTSENNLSYTKIGRMVFLSGQVYIDSVSSPTGTLTIGNLPCAITSLPQRADASCIQVTPRFTTTNTPYFYGVAITPSGKLHR